MRTDPIRLNFYQGAGGYAWQLAEYLQSNQAEEGGGHELRKATAPFLSDSLFSYPERLYGNSSVKWSNKTRITSNVSHIVGDRGVRSSLVVAESAQTFGSFRDEDIETLSQERRVDSLIDIGINGLVYPAATVLITLIRHNLVETDQVFTQSRAAHYMIEPTCLLVDTPDAGRVAINHLNGRMIRLSDTSRRIFDAQNSAFNISEDSREDIARFVRAGMLRFVLDENVHEHD